MGERIEAGITGSIIRCYVSDRAMAILRRVSAETGREITELAEAAIESEALKADNQ